eukprot:m.102440 g.102440  ORF g.102440 m.102440 type:complete len:224 (+) comp37174_c0_seq16:200-871(+)
MSYSEQQCSFPDVSGNSHNYVISGSLAEGVLLLLLIVVVCLFTSLMVVIRLLREQRRQTANHEEIRKRDLAESDRHSDDQIDSESLECKLEWHSSNDGLRFQRRKQGSDLGCDTSESFHTKPEDCGERLSRFLCLSDASIQICVVLGIWYYHHLVVSSTFKVVSLYLLPFLKRDTDTGLKQLLGEFPLLWLVNACALYFYGIIIRLSDDIKSVPQSVQQESIK